MNIFGIRPKANAESIDETGAWLSISDLMSGMLMIFALLLIATLARLTESLDESAKVQVMIIKDINDGLKEAGIELKANEQTGELSITNALLFEEGSYQLSSQGKAFIKRLIPIYSNAIFLTPGASEEVERIKIIGHASNEGDFTQNMKLSMLRSYSVVESVDEMIIPFKKGFINKLMPAGRGSIEANKSIVDVNDRKVVFQFQFKDRKFFEYLKKEFLVNE
jgi:outer membrane protein OmpA-like peptidoglycan-associated protein